MSVDQTETQLSSTDTSARPSAHGSWADGSFLEQRAVADAIASLTVTLQSLHQINAGFNCSADPITSLVSATPAIQCPSPSPPVAVHCLGAFEVRLNGRPVDTWHAVKPRTLFQYLVSHRDRAVSREALIDALWPDPDTAPAGTALKVVVHRVRKLLRQTGPRIEILATEDGYRLESPDLWVDVEEFERSCMEARRQELSGRIGDAARAYARAATLYRGDFLQDVPDEWVVLRRERLKDLYLLSLARLTDAAFADLDYEQCIERCQQILGQDPCREQAYRVLMLCYAHLGQRGRVRRWYEVCVRTLRGELDVDPEPDTQATYEQAMAGNLSGLHSVYSPLTESPTGNRHVTAVR